MVPLEFTQNQDPKLYLSVADRYVQSTCASVSSHAPNLAFLKCGRFQEPEPQQKTLKSPGLELLAQRRHISEACVNGRRSLDS